MLEPTSGHLIGFFYMFLLLLWRMFAFGFGGIFVITQMHGVGLSRRVLWIILALYIAAALTVYGQYDLTQIHQMTWIPFIEYLGVLILAGIFAAGLWVAGRIEGKRWPEI